MILIFTKPEVCIFTHALIHKTIMGCHGLLTHKFKHFNLTVC